MNLYQKKTEIPCEVSGATKNTPALAWLHHLLKALPSLTYKIIPYPCYTFRSPISQFCCYSFGAKPNLARFNDSSFLNHSIHCIFLRRSASRYIPNEILSDQVNRPDPDGFPHIMRIRSGNASGEGSCGFSYPKSAASPRELQSVYQRLAMGSLNVENSTEPPPRRNAYPLHFVQYTRCKVLAPNYADEPVLR